ncbi:MAG: hypothetical protein AAGG50_15420 [Bacteroidota bacterium]
MHVLLDYAASVIAGSVALLLLLGTVARSSEADRRVSAVGYAKEQALDLATWLEDDLSTIGMGLPTGEVRLTMPTQAGSGTTLRTTRFEFTRRTYDTSGPTPVVATVDVRYDLAPTTTTTIDGATVQLYEVQRSERVNGGAWQDAGKTPASLSRFHVEVQDMVGSPTGAEANAAFVDVSFTMIPPLMQDEVALPALFWNAAFRIHPV